MAPQKIAVLNDDRTFLQVLKRLLTHAGYTVVIGEIGSTGQQLIRQEQPDLVVVDMQRHQPATGWKYLRALRRDPATTTLPVLVCSSDARLLREQAERLRRAHFEILPLPFTPTELLQKVTHILEGTSRQSAPLRP
jgi:CheY-like chemotaxis protein